MPPKNAPPRPKIEGKASKDASKSSTPPASSKAKTTPRENPTKPKAAAQEKPKAKAAVSPRGDLQQQLAAAEARASEAEVRAAEAEARVKVAEEATIAASALEAAAHESHRGEGGKQAAAEAEERAANLAKLCEEQKATLAEAEKAAAAVQRSLEEQIAALKQQLSVSGQGESAGPSAEPASGATATDAVADVQAVAGSPFKVLIDLGEDASGDGLQVHVQLDGQLGGLSTSSSDDIAR